MREGRFYHRDISLYILGYHLVFLDVFFLFLDTVVFLVSEMLRFLRILCSPLHSK